MRRGPREFEQKTTTFDEFLHGFRVHLANLSKNDHVRRVFTLFSAPTRRSPSPHPPPDRLRTILHFLVRSALDSLERPPTRPGLWRDAGNPPNPPNPPTRSPPQKKKPA